MYNVHIITVLSTLCTIFYYLFIIWGELHILSYLCFRPDLVDYNKLTKVNNVQNLNNAFNVAEEKLGLTRLLDAEGIVFIFYIIIFKFNLFRFGT